MPECARTQASGKLGGRCTGPAGPLMVGVQPHIEGLRGLLQNENLPLVLFWPLRVSGIGLSGYRAIGYRVSGNGAGPAELTLDRQVRHPTRVPKPSLTQPCPTPLPIPSAHLRPPRSLLLSSL